jgi:poly-beta-1,6-N-acetyl-D-glucosamine synthase
LFQGSEARGVVWLGLRGRFAVTMVVALGWAGGSVWLDWAWAQDLGRVITLFGAWVVIVGIAVLPGYLNAQLLASLVVDRPPRGELPDRCPDVTVLVAAYNEQVVIQDTLASLLGQDYPARMWVIVVDDGSTDASRDVVRAIAATDDRVRLVEAAHAGKAGALNRGLAECATDLVCTVDADTVLSPYALLRLVTRLVVSPPDTVAVAGSVQVRNGRSGMLARMQHFDYYLAIASIKRQQALLQGTLVAQGAFSLYRADAVRTAGGWPDLLGEDIVLTWAMLRNHGRTVFEATAVASTQVPTGLRTYLRQRRRWSRGMLEGLRLHGPQLLVQRRMLSHSIANNFLMPYLDFTYSIALPIGIVAALRGDFLIVGPVTLAVMPVNLLVVGAMRRRQRRAFARARLPHPRRDSWGFACYFLCYQLLAAPAACSGYLAEALGLAEQW